MWSLRTNSCSPCEIIRLPGQYGTKGLTTYASHTPSLCIIQYTSLPPSPSQLMTLTLAMGECIRAVGRGRLDVYGAIGGQRSEACWDRISNLLPITYAIQRDDRLLVYACKRTHPLSGFSSRRLSAFLTLGPTVSCRSCPPRATLRSRGSGY